MIQSQVPSAWRRSTPDRGPGQAPGGDGAIGKARRGEGQVAADHGPRVEPEDTLLADGEFPVCRHRAGKVRPDGVRAAQQPPLAAVDDGRRLIKGDHSLDVSRVLAGDQQALQVLRITGGAAGRCVGHGNTPLLAIHSNQDLRENANPRYGPQPERRSLGNRRDSAPSAAARRPHSPTQGSPALCRR